MRAITPSKQPCSLLGRFYEKWLGTAPQAAMNRQARRKLLRPILPNVRSVCELAYGKGTTAIEFARRGWRVYAVSLSPTMCRLARERARRVNVGVRVIRADMRHFRLPERVDLVTCEFHTLNHVPRADLERVARSVARALRPGGYFYFDVNTPAGYERLRDQTHWVKNRDFVALFLSWFNRRQGGAVVDAHLSSPAGGLWQRYRERLDFFCWSPAEIRTALRKAGFRRIRCFPAVEVHPPRMSHHNVYYLAQKSPASSSKR